MLHLELLIGIHNKLSSIGNPKVISHDDTLEHRRCPGDALCGHRRLAKRNSIVHTPYIHFKGALSLYIIR
jgi:hypothetical protein